MKIAQPAIARVLWLTLPLVAACYVERPDSQGLPSSSLAGRAAPSGAVDGPASEPLPVAPGIDPRNDGSGGRGADAGRPRGPVQPSPPARDAGAAASGGTGGCGAIRAPGQSVSADTSAFTGVGGAGFDLVGICDRCGWNHRADSCQSLVYTVPTIAHSEYYPCLDLSLEWVGCLETRSCICSGDVPDGCQQIKDQLDACLLVQDAGL